MLEYPPQREEHGYPGLTTSPTTGNSHDLVSRGSFGPQQLHCSSGVL